MMEVREARRAQTSAYPLPPSESAGAGSPSDSSGDSRSSFFIVTGSPPPAS
jgi:hypothetical protein